MSYLRHITSNRSTGAIPKGAPVEQESIGAWEKIVDGYNKEKPSKIQTIIYKIKKKWIQWKTINCQ